MITLVYKMTHKGDPDPNLGHWGVEDCMGRVRGFKYDAIIGVGGRCWWTGQTNRTGEIIWIGIGPQKSVQGKRGPKIRFAHFRYFREGEITLREVAPQLDNTIHRCRFKLSGFSQSEQQEIERILELAKKTKPSASLPTKAIQSQRDGKKCCRKVCRRRLNRE
jgi:hypothetical protein